MECFLGTVFFLTKCQDNCCSQKNTSMIINNGKPSIWSVLKHQYPKHCLRTLHKTLLIETIIGDQYNISVTQKSK